MQKYEGGKQTAAAILPKIEIEKTLEQNLSEDKKTSKEEDKETKLEQVLNFCVLYINKRGKRFSKVDFCNMKRKSQQVAKSVEKLVEKDTVKTITEENRENKFITYTAKNSTAEAYNSTEEFYGSESTNYYDNLMHEEKPASELRQEHHEQKKEHQAEQSQYFARDSNEFGAQLTREGMPTREEQTSLGASSVRAEAMYLFKMLNPGWWKCLYELKAI